MAENDIIENDIRENDIREDLAELEAMLASGLVDDYCTDHDDECFVYDRIVEALGVLGEKVELNGNCFDINTSRGVIRVTVKCEVLGDLTLADSSATVD